MSLESHRVRPASVKSNLLGPDAEFPQDCSQEFYSDVLNFLTNNLQNEQICYGCLLLPLELLLLNRYFSSYGFSDRGEWFSLKVQGIWFVIIVSSYSLSDRGEWYSLKVQGIWFVIILLWCHLVASCTHPL